MPGSPRSASGAAFAAATRGRESFRKYGKGAVAWLDELGLVDENLVLGHAIWVTEDDIDRLAARRASVTTHPSCNLGMRNGLAPIYAMHKRGVNVALGLGRVVMEHRRMTTLDVDALYREVRKAARSISPRQRRHALMLQRLKPHYQDWYNAWLTPKDVKPFYVLNSRA